MMYAALCLYLSKGTNEDAPKMLHICMWSLSQLLPSSEDECFPRKSLLQVGFLAELGWRQWYAGKSSHSLRPLISSPTLLVRGIGLFGLRDELERRAGWEMALGLSAGAPPCPECL